ncbi:MAG: Fis family transcriptional regulator [candidate division Zixibacteria bacterium SM23_81]|nr:MAG: Fis family transcriptional regulator [candidate division Zixibacteria bacterium SM23_81]
MSPLDQKERILIVDDAPDTLEMIQRNLTSQGYEVFTAPGVVEAIKFLEGTPVELIITDLKMPKVSGMELIRHVRENLKDTEVMMITGYATVEGAVEAVKSGAEEYLSKPFTDQELFNAVRRTLDKLHMRRTQRVPATEKAPSTYGLIGESKVMRKVFDSIAKAASTPATILLSGESGTGKELVARAIHYSSQRASAPFVPINCGAIPGELFESELFGHVKGSFTGASESRAGFFQTADGGTIFLDEIGEMSLSLQVKLLRVLQDKEVFMVGSTRPRKVDVRILAATNMDLPGLVKKGTFREDLFFRVSVIAIAIPPLRERRDDILLLANHFLNKFSEEFGKPIPRFSDKVLQLFKNYAWPGNVRELENIVQQLVVMTEGNIIDITDMPSHMRFSALRGTGLDRTLAEVETEHIRNVLASVNGNKTKAAQILAIDRKTLREKLKNQPPSSSS